MKRFVMLLILTALLLLTGCMKTEPATVATISPAHETVVEEDAPDNRNVCLFSTNE